VKEKETMKHLGRLSLVALFAGLLAAPAAAQESVWEIDASHSSATFAVRHMMVTTVRGEFGKMEGKVGFDGQELTKATVEATIDASTINTRDAKRDAHLRTADFFDVENHPTITFKSKRAETVSPGKFRLIGDLTMRGVTREVVLDVEGPTEAIKDARGNARIGAQATTKINRKDYGINWSRTLDGGGLVVGDEVQVTLDLALVRKAPAPTAAVQ
jgi:polyisoprenoid-binding protein YceI